MVKHGEMAILRWLRAILVSLVTSLVTPLLMASAFAADQPSRVPRPSIKAGDGANCVADTAFMRTNHMDLLKHQRDDTVHQGIRTPRFSLKGCVDCHAGKQTKSVIREADDFCRSCHTYAGVTLDCFECHSSTARAHAGNTAPVSAPALTRSAEAGGKR
jgi:hypothetical protein